MAVQLSVNNVGWIYIGVTITWTIVLFSSMGFLWYHRRLPQIRMRRLPLVFVALPMLHIYWTLCMIGYVIGPVAPCAAEYWIMSILLPFGIAMFQIANTQFLYVASQQRRFTSVTKLDEFVQGKKVSILDGHTGSFWERMTRRLKNVNHITKMVICVGIGMAIQAVLTILIFLLSRKFHPEFGVLPANLFGTDAEQRMQCSRGWEWWLSIVWQFFWAWLYAPYILWRSRGIKDTHGWRTQTVLCCIAGLPCSPLWLCGLYLPQFSPINAVFIPPNWFSVSIFLIEAFTVFIPCYQVFRHHNLRSETLAAIAQWEAKNKALSSSSIDTGTTQVSSLADLRRITFEDLEKGNRLKSVDEGISSFRKSHMYTMTALEHALKWNADPLQKFAALKDFSGENVSFLTHLASWKKDWPNLLNEDVAQQPQRGQRESVNQLRIRDHFNRGINLYAAFVSLEYAEFPVNVSCRTLRHLESIFKNATEILFGDASSETTCNSATPFEVDRNRSVITVEMHSLTRKSSEHSVLNLDEIWYWGRIPEEFTIDCFDEAEREVKYLVLTNTWPKFVNAGCAELSHDAEGRVLARRLSTFFNP